MTLYQLLARISDIITPQDDTFFKYVIYTSDDNGGFLRTRPDWQGGLKDKKIGDGFKKVLVTSKQIINIDDLKRKPYTYVKIQITYSNKNAIVEDAICDIELGYRNVYIVDLENETYDLTVF